MKRTILLFISFFIISISYGQTDWTSGKLILKNGESLKGLIKVTNNSKIHYKEKKKAKKKKFGPKEVDKVYFGVITNANIGYYEYVYFGLLDGFVLAKLVIFGKAKLYIRTRKVIEEKSFGTDIHTSTIKKYRIVKDYLVFREGESISTIIINSDQTDGSSFEYNKKIFNKRVVEYFSDCPDIKLYLENEVYSDFDIYQILEDYNLLCE